MHRRLAAVLLALALPACAAPRSADESVEPFVEIFDGATLDGWHALGDARYTVDDGCILGEVGGGGQSFLVSDGRYGDFVLELDVRNELPGNSGVQVRSQVREDGRLFGYQIEIDPSERAWSGGLYDEARRGWLDDLADDAAARAAFRPGEWNRYRIECRGGWIRAWVNGVSTADHLDAVDLEGHIALQVHSGNDTRVRWRDLRLTDLGARTWRAVPVEVSEASVPIEGESGAVRFLVRGDPARPNSFEMSVWVADMFQGSAQVTCPGDPVGTETTWSVDVIWQDGRFAVRVDGDDSWSDKFGSGANRDPMIVLKPGAGLSVLSAAVLAPPRR